jgi:uncharacterized protein (DUF1499 family)
MSKALAVSSGVGAKVLRRGPAIGLVLAGLALALLALGPLGWRMNWWSYRTGFALVGDAAYGGIAAALLSILSLIPGPAVIGRRGIALGLVGAVLGAAVALVPWSHTASARGLPSIHDITTDPADPPQFRAIAAVRSAAGANSSDYEGPRIAALQARAYPDIRPLTVAAPPETAFRQALDTAERLGWTVVAADPAEGRIEASDRTRWFGFTDDVVIRVRPAGSGSRIDLRSSSRIGRGDRGVNAARIRRFAAALQASGGSR